MKTQLLLILLTTMIGHGWAMKNKQPNPIVGTWKYSNQSVKNDFQPVLNAAPYSTQYFIFEPNSQFIHEFLDDQGKTVKILKGKWRAFGDRVKITYNDFDYTVYVDYFFLDNDLVLGENFNHVIFTKNDVYNTGETMIENKTAMK